MSSALINRSPDLTRLRDEGFDIEVNGGYLLVRDVPYVAPGGSVQRGTLVSELTLAGDRTARPGSHVIFFTGQQPCHKNGTVISGIQHSEGAQQQGGLTVHRSFSNKPPEGYADYYDKVSRYVEIISAPAMALDSTATPRLFRPVRDEATESPLVYVDTNTSRSHCQEVTQKLTKQKVGIVGLGGTGSYVLDFLAKTPVQEIRLFDGDLFLQHNAFRAPGAASLEQLEKRLAKVVYLAELYGRMHRGVNPVAERLASDNLARLDGLDFVFLCLDSGPSKRQIVDHLLANKIPFVDCGIGVQKVDGRLIGIVRATTATPAKHDHLPGRMSFADADDDAYSTNIQIAELNALNAAIAVIRWKKLLGFYADFEHEHHTTYSLDTGMLLHEDVHT
jgi:hypothetical protein